MSVNTGHATQLQHFLGAGLGSSPSPSCSGDLRGVRLDVNAFSPCATPDDLLGVVLCATPSPGWLANALSSNYIGWPALNRGLKCPDTFRCPYPSLLACGLAVAMMVGAMCRPQMRTQDTLMSASRYVSEANMRCAHVERSRPGVSATVFVLPVSASICPLKVNVMCPGPHFLT